jgi:hypothetical protein
MRDNSSSNNRIKINYNAAFGLVSNACICVTDSTVLDTHTHTHKLRTHIITDIIIPAAMKIL